MWAAVLLLAIAVNFEPTRIGLVAYLLSRPRPQLLLLTFLCGALAMTSGVGLLVLFVVRNGPVDVSSFNGAKIQIMVGVLAIFIAALLFAKISLDRLTPARPKEADTASCHAPTASEPALPSSLAKLSTRARELLKEGSPWLSGAIGVGIGLPSIDYLAMLAVIAASGAAPGVQVAALLTFLVVAHAVVEAPLAGYVLAPTKTRALVGTLHSWVRARRRRDFAALLAIAGCVMVVIGLRRL